MEGMWREIRVCVDSEEYAGLKRLTENTGLSVSELVKEMIREKLGLSSEPASA